MRTLQIYSGNLYGGVEKTLTMIAEGPGAFERECALVFGGRLRRDLIRAGARVHDLGRVRARWPWTVARARRALRAVLARSRFEVVICHSAWSQAIFGPVVRQAGLPLVFWLHDVAAGRHWIERWARLTVPDVVICNSRFTARSAASMYPHLRPEVVRPPVLTEDGGPLPQRADVRRELGVDGDAVVIIQVARLEPLKGHDAHLGALSLLKDIAPRWLCWMVGGAQRPHETTYLRALQRKAAALGLADRVRFLGRGTGVAAGRPSSSAGWVVVFVLTMFACQAMIAFGPFPGIRTWLRVAVYAFSLALVALTRGAGLRHPAALPATAALLIVGLSLFHPDTPGYVPGAIHAGLYLAILAPLFWAPRLHIDAQMLKRVLVLIWAFHSLSAALGVLQVQFPGTFDPNLSAVIDPDVASASVITNARGDVVYRAMGVSDIPGAAGVSGLYAAAIGTALFVVDRRRLMRVLCVASMTLALTSIYLAQLRSTLVIAALIVSSFVVCLALRRSRRALLTLIIVVLTLLASLNIAVLIGGTEVFDRIATLIDERPQTVYYANRGHFLEQTFTEDLPDYPLGAGLARWGMARHYFGGVDSAAESSSLWVEIQWTGWLLDGGVPLMIAYSGAVAVALITDVR